MLCHSFICDIIFITRFLKLNKIYIYILVVSSLWVRVWKEGWRIEQGDQEKMLFFL